MGDRKTYRVKLRVYGYVTYEIDAINEQDAVDEYAFGKLAYEDLDYYPISATAIDVAETGT